MSVETAPALQDWLTRSGFVVLLPGLNHLLQQAPSGREAEYLRLAQTIAPQALTALLDWLQQTTAMPVRP